MAKGRHHQRRSLSIRSTANVLIIIMISALLGKMHRRGFAVAFVQGIRREGGGSRLLLSCADDSSSSPFGRVVHHLHGVTRTLFPIFPVRHFSAKRNNQIDSASRASYDQSLTEKLNLLDEQESIVTNDQQIVEVVEELIKPSGWRRSLYRRAGGALSAIGFVTSASRALWLPDPEQSRQWKPTVDALRAFLQTTGIDSELSALLNVRLLDNIIILSRIEKAALKGEDRRDRVLSEAAVSISNDEALRYMKYATAVYGDTMIRAAEMDVLGKFDPSFSTVTRTRIGEHCSIPAENIVLMNIDYGGDDNHLRHFVAVDHKNKKVVLAIRGTFSLSELVVDVAGFSRSFCNGEAHSEMATMAERVWSVAESTVLNMLEENLEYEFIITGHSLGAGTASLLNIMCHQNDREIIRGRKVRCIAFASPPTFTPMEVVPEAFNACTNFINERDVVPFLSVDAVRHLFNCVKAVEGQELSWIRRMKLIAGYVEPDEALIAAVRKVNGNRLVTKPGAPFLVVPASTNLWMRENKLAGTYDIKVCDSMALATLGILIDSKMLEDHFPSRYEHALHNLK